jgi:glutamate-1-semialdehyde 2,1-aminomutase/spore coat polysaccharide biosynthesis protein SpsF
MTVVAIVQARMASARLPGKVLADVVGKPLLGRVVERVRRARTIDRVVVATSDSPSDDPVAEFCSRAGIDCFRGSEADVLDRFYQASRAYPASAYARITGDCPLHDPEVIDRVVNAFLDKGCDYAANVIRYTFPDGLDTEVFTATALERTWRSASLPAEREHVTPHMRQGNRFRIRSVENEIDLSGDHRWSVDHPGDLEFVRAVYAYLADRPDFGLHDVLRLLEEKPGLRAIQERTVLNEGYYHSLYQQAAAGPAPKLCLEKSREWFARSGKVIPGCAQTFSKGHTQYVQGVAPLFLARGKGCRVEDVDGNTYLDFVQGLLPNILGYAHDGVNAAVAEQLGRGHSFSLPHPLEVQLAERLVRLIPCAEMVRFAKNGSDATSGAVRVSRAFTGRERIACCGYHGWQDWYIGSTTRHLGVPESTRALTRTFVYNDASSLEKILQAHPGEYAAVIMEPVNFFQPNPGFLEEVKQITHRHGALLIFDEICSGFHFGLGGAQKRYGVTPDLACFGKAMGNGFPIACVVGRTDVMKVFEEVFFSFTFGGEAASLAAAMVVLDVLEQTDVLARMEANGRRLQDGFNSLAKEAGLRGLLECIGHPTWSLIRFRDDSGKDSPLVKSLFQQEVVKRGVLILATHNLTAAHDTDAVEETLHVYASVMKTLVGWLGEADPTRRLEGAMIQPVFRTR